jgi:hypothetical protein
MMVKEDFAVSIQGHNLTSGLEKAKQKPDLGRVAHRLEGWYSAKM